MKNKMKLEFMAIGPNEALARSCISAFAMQLDPTIEQLIEIKTAVSEAVTNAVVHAYKAAVGSVTIRANIKSNELHIHVSDKGCGICDINKAMEPFFTTAVEHERSGMGFSVMESFMDKVNVASTPGKGTTVKMIKYIGVKNESK